MRSPIVSIEEWLFKLRRVNMFDVFQAEIDEAKQFKETVEKTGCPACSKKELKLSKFERGPQGWECEIICEGCNFSATVNSGWTLFNQVDSKGRAREK